MRRKIKKKFSARIKFLLFKFLPGIIITLVIFAFHIRLFIPELSIYITPDYGRSDSWHLSIANKFYYAQELKKNRIPIWNPHIGTGYPTLAEGQTAIFFLPNLFFFRTLPFVWAYNLTLVLSFLTAGWGVYMFCRSLGLSKLASTYAGTIFPLGAFFVFHVQHHNLLQTASLMPWLFWATNEFLVKRKVIFLLALSFIFSQQIFAGFPQLTFYSLVALCIYIFIKSILAKLNTLKVFLITILAVILGFGISAIQILPSYEFFKISARDLSPAKVLGDFPYNFKNLLQFLNPFILGSPRNGTYPEWKPEQWGIFWESTAYVGLIPLVTALAVLLLVFSKKLTSKPLVIIFTFIFITSIILTLGKNTPFQTIFSVPPFSLFRVPSRFLLVTQFSLTILAAIYMQKFYKRKIIASLTIFAAILNLFWILFNYNPAGSAKTWFKEPETANFIKANYTGRIYNMGAHTKWNDNFLNYGWQDTSYYFFARNSLSQNSNLIFNLSHFSAYESLLSERYTFLTSLISLGTKLEENNTTFTNTSKNILRANNVSHIVSPRVILDAEINKVFEITNKEGNIFNVYKLANTLEPYFFVPRYKVAQKKSDLWNIFNDQNVDIKNEAVLEEDLGSFNFGSNNNVIKTIYAEPEYTKLEILTENDSLLIINESYYPGWRAFINGKETKIHPANVNSKAIKVPKGDSTVEVKFNPKSYQDGRNISAISIVVLIALFLQFKKSKVL